MLVRWFKPFLPLLLFTIALTGCTAVSPITPEQAAVDRIPLKVAVAPYLSYAPFFIAQAEGYFEEQGLDVEIVRVTRSSDAIATLAQGELDVAGFPIASGLLNAMVRDSGLKIVASKERLAAQECVYSGIVVRNGLDLTDEATVTPELLRSLNYEVTPTGESGYVVDLLLQRYGVSLDEITLVEAPNAASVMEVMQQGGVDVAAMTEPWVTQAIAAGAGTVWMSRNDIAPDGQLAIIAYGPTLLHDNPEAGERFMVAYLKAVRHFTEGMTESTLTLLEKELELDRDLLRAMCPPYIPLDGAINAQSIVDFGEWAASKDFIDAPLTEEQFWEPRFVNFANAQLESAE